MMVPKKSLILAGAALALVSASISAQSQSGKVFMRYNKPLKNVSLDLATGTVTHGPSVNNKSATTTVDFNNNDLGGFVGVDTGGSFCEWFDAANKGFAGNASDLMNDIVFAYCSAKLTPGSGGPGGSVKLGFYEGYVVGGGAPTTGVAAFTLTGLPGNSASSSFFGGFSCFFIRVFFVNLVAFSDGPIGYSWKFLDVGATGVLAGTWPFLSCVSSCSGTISGPPDGQGMTDRIDEYCPVGTLRSSFTFGTLHLAGTVVSSFTSISMDIREATDLAATLTNYNATTSPNGDTLTAAGLERDGVTPVPANPNLGGAVVGGTWKCTVVRSPVTGAGSCTVKIRPTRVAAPNGFPAPPPVGGRVLTSGAPLATIIFAHNGTTGTCASQSIPQQLGFLCLHFAGQSVTTPSIRLSSAIEGTTGTN